MSRKRMPDAEIAIAISSMMKTLQCLLDLSLKDDCNPDGKKFLLVDTDVLMKRLNFFHQEILTGLTTNQLVSTKVVLPRSVIDELQTFWKKVANPRE